MLYNELEVFHRKPGEAAQLRCRVCGSTCSVTRDASGPTCWSAAVAGLRVRHDRFTCPHAGEPWHDRARSLHTAIREQPSRWLAALMRLEQRRLIRINRHSLQSPAQGGRP